MDKDKLISFITENQSLYDYPEVASWITRNEENKDEYIRYKNLWAIMQYGDEISEKQIEDGLVKIKKNSRQSTRLRIRNFLRYAAFLVMVLLGGYIAGTYNTDSHVAMNQVFVPKGSRTSLVLPDGTKVWLSNGTKLIYPENFGGKTRDVELEGEGFFDVTHDKEHPFIVNIGENRIKVFGTRFAVVAYSQDNIVKAELVSGKIQFDINKGNESLSYMMKPSQSLIFDKVSGKLSESKISNSFYNYWLNGVYEFKDETFKNLAKRIEQIYNIQIIFKEESLKNRLFTGSLSIDDNIYTMMEVFRRASGEPFAYTHEGNRIFIEGKK
jgi:ferric-dicitrate binding protein FerR (iron transport regulator)